LAVSQKIPDDTYIQFGVGWSSSRGAYMDDKKKLKDENYDCEPECDCGPECDCDEDYDIEIVELEDDNGDKQDFAILDEIDFENRHFAILAPLAEVQAFNESEDENNELDLSIEIFEVEDEHFTPLEDEAMAKRLMEYLESISEGEEED